MWGIARKNLRECEKRTQGLERGNLACDGNARKSTIASLTLYPTDLVFRSPPFEFRSAFANSAFRVSRSALNGLH
jgi:hypothetical protein